MLTALILLATASSPSQDPLARGFATPPLSARPHTWWHWLNGNVTKAGITADLEAMKQVGIGGAQMFTVDQGVPAGPAKYVGPLWREMTAYAVKEAARLGLELCIHNGAGWSSSGGPWIKPEYAMQVIAWSRVNVNGPQHYSETLPPIKAPQVDSVVNYHKDIAVYAYRTPSEGDTQGAKTDRFLDKTGVNRGDGLTIDTSPTASGMAIPSSELITLTKHLDSSGRLTWDVPEGAWTILRVGHVPTGVHNHPAPPEGDGLEVDKLSKEALDTHWAGLMAKVVADSGKLSGKVLNNVLIDSYEVGDQNWSPKFREEFLHRRGYDPLPFLPVITGCTIDSREKSERFLWDLRRTIADLYADNYFGHMAELCHKNGLLFSTEPYGNGGFDNIQAGGTADIPMGEFWLGGGTLETAKLAASTGHVYGRPVIGAESFTGDDVRGRWLEEPYDLKALGDMAFSLGINRYIFHRYAMQPWTNLKPGMTMGPWGTHLERTQTWWTEAATWMKYIQRCQYLLQSGRFVADACYFYGEDAPNDLRYGPALSPKLPAGFDYDGCDLKTFKSMTVKDGRIQLPSGMSYAVLVLPESKFMTPAVAAKVRELVKAGATVVAPKPSKSPSLQGYPSCDNQISVIADQVWGPGKESDPLVHIYGKGRVVSGKPLGDVLKGLNVKPDFEFAPHDYGTKLVYIHRKVQGTDVYFVSNQNQRNTLATCTFRSGDRVPELWHPESGQIEDAPAYSTRNGQSVVQLRFAPSESVFVVFRKAVKSKHLTFFGPVQAIRSAPRVPILIIDKARYETLDGRGVDVTDKVKEMVREGQREIPSSNSVYGDPVVNVVKHLVVEYRLGGKKMVGTAAENGSLDLIHSEHPKPEATAFDLVKRTLSSFDLTAWKPASFLFDDTSGVRHSLDIRQTPTAIDLSRQWKVTFPPHLGAPASTTFDKLASWTANADSGIKYFSGSATYAKSFTVPASFVSEGHAIRLDLGHVKNFATVVLNGKEVAVLWKPPFALDVTKFIRAGVNHLEVKVTNLWVNRLIGDEQLPADVEWQDGHLAKWPSWLLNGQPRPKTGRVAFATWHFWGKDSPLLESGMMGPVKLMSAKKVIVKF